MRRTGPIRYATANRFEPPQAVQHEESVPGAICPQAPARLESVIGVPTPPVPQSEDCLQLSITTPAYDEGRRPVMVWLHGGAFISGGGVQPWYDGARLTCEQDVVVVSINYRLGAFGFLLLDGVSAGNLGLLDQLEALRWVQRNIAQYGGDPSNVTIFGQSAGGMSAALLLGMPEAGGLFHRAIVQSAPLRLFHGVERAEQFGQELVRQLDVDPRAATPEQLVAATKSALVKQPVRPGVDLPFAPVTQLYPIAREQDQMLAENIGGRDVLCGSAVDEATAFGFGFDEAAEPSAVAFADPSARFRAHATAAGSRAYSYSITWRPSGSPFGATHCIELPLLLGSENTWRGSPMLGDTPWDQVEQFGRAMRRAWASFARTGIPDDDELAGWPITLG